LGGWIPVHQHRKAVSRFDGDGNEAEQDNRACSFPGRPHFEGNANAMIPDAGSDQELEQYVRSALAVQRVQQDQTTPDADK
jgi:hypothetical protein